MPLALEQGSAVFAEPQPKTRGITPAAAVPEKVTLSIRTQEPSCVGSNFSSWPPCRSSLRPPAKTARTRRSPRPRLAPPRCGTETRATAAFPRAGRGSTPGPRHTMPASAARTRTSCAPRTRPRRSGTSSSTSPSSCPASPAASTSRAASTPTGLRTGPPALRRRSTTLRRRPGRARRSSRPRRSSARARPTASTTASPRPSAGATAAPPAS